MSSLLRSNITVAAGTTTEPIYGRTYRAGHTDAVGHQAECGVATGAVGDRRHGRRVDEAVLLGQLGARILLVLLGFRIARD